MIRRHSNARIGIIVFLILMLFTIDSAESKMRGQIDTVPSIAPSKLSTYSQAALSQINDDQEVRIIVKYRKGEPRTDHGPIKTEKEMQKLGIAKVISKKNALSAMEQDPSIESIEIDQQMTFSTESIPWNVNITNAPNAWNMTKGGGASIAILDSGIAPHPDLRIAGGTSVISDNYTDTYGHGIAVAGVIGSLLDDAGLIGVAPESNIYAVKITDGPTGMISDALAGLDWAIANNMSVISMSFGFNEYSPAFAAAVQEAYQNGAILVAAAGNNNGEVLFPARYDQVIAVGSIDQNLQRAPTSNYGSDLELMAPGVDINTTRIDGGYATLSGTSLAVPHVAGIAALIKSANPTLTNTEIRNILQNSARDFGDAGKDDYYGYGLAQYPTNQNTTTIEEPLIHYTIYNLSYVNETEQLTYWKSGNGSYQQENLTNGLYLINNTQGMDNWIERINVTNQEIFQLLASAKVTDTFTTDNSPNDDGIGFKNDADLSVQLQNPGPNGDAYCVDFGNDGVYELCRYNDTNDYTNCYNYASGLSGEEQAYYQVCPSNPELGECPQDINLNDVHQGIDTTTITANDSSIMLYTDCDNSASARSANEYFDSYWITDTRRAVCTSDTTYRMEGRYTTGGAYLIYKNSLTCTNTRCDYSRDDEITTTNRTTAINPCRLDTGATCTATEQCLNGLNCSNSICANLTGQSSNDAKCTGNISIVIDNKPTQNNISSMPIYINGLVNGTTNSDGQFNIFYKNTTCSAGLNVTAFCLNTTTPCGNATIRFDSSNFTSRVFDCRICTFNKDISISSLSSFQATHQNETNVSFTLLVGSLNTSTLSALLFQNDLKTSTNLNIFSIGLSNIPANASFNTSILMPRNDSKLRLMIDPTNTIAESDETNNQLEVISLASKVSIYLNISTGNKMVDAAIDERMRSLFPIKLENESDIVIAIGHPRYNTYTAAFNQITLSLNPAWGVKNQLPYADGANNIQGVIGRLSGANKTKIFIIADFFGTGPESIVTTTRIFIANQTLLTTNLANQIPPITFDRTNEIYQTTVDEMTSIPKNRERELPAFKDLIAKILSEQAYDETIHHVDSGVSGITLRIRHLKPITSTNYTAEKVGDKPVILARGIFSTLDDWRSLGEKLANSGFDSWLIEITGGPQQDCPTCPDYTVNQMAQNFVPSLINGVRNLSNKDQIKYVGYSNGCNAALLSLQNGSISGNKFDTFIGIACPGNFSTTTPGGTLLQLSDIPVTLRTGILDIDHISIQTIVQSITPFIPLTPAISRYLSDLSLEKGGPYSISKNLYFDYVHRAESDKDTQPGVGVSIPNTYFVAGKAGRDSTSDTVVPISDMQGICNNFFSNDTKLFSTIRGVHFPIGFGPSLPDDETTQTAIEQFLKSKSVNHVLTKVNCSE